MIGESTLGDLKCLSIVMEIVVVQTLVSRRVLLRAILAFLGVALTRSRECFCSLLEESLIIIYGTQLMLAVVEHSKGRLDTAEQ